MKKHRDEFKDRVCISNLKDPDWFARTTRRKINFQNGVLDLDTMEMTPHSPEMGFRHVVNYSFDPNAKSPVFDRMLKRICVNDVGLEACLLEYMGYALSNDVCWVHRALVLFGEGENGKSTFMNVLRELAGKDNYCSLTLTELRKEGNRQLLDGKLFNMAEETPSHALMESSLFKNLVSGGETQVRQLWKLPYIMKNRAKMIFACNSLPGSKDTSKGFFRRFLIVPFAAEFKDTDADFDPFIDDKLKAELPGIFNRAVKAYQEMQRRGKFTIAQASKDALEEYRSEVDTAAAWIAAHITTEPKKPSYSEEERGVAIHDIYTAYVESCRRGNVEVLNSITFGKKLAKQLPDYKDRVKKVKMGAAPVRMLMGIRLEAQFNVLM